MLIRKSFAMKLICRSLVIATACLFASSLAIAQSPVIVYPAGTYSVTTPAPTQIVVTSTSIVFSWGVSPIPTPPPIPVPPPPTPPPPPVPPAPIADAGLRVLMVYESSELTKYPPSQLAVLYDAQLRSYMSKVCVLGDKTYEWRVYDKDADLSSESKIWREAMARPHPKLPWILISNGKTGYEGPLPSSTAETQSLIQKYEVH